MNDQLIISLTSWPKRIKYIGQNLLSIAKAAKGTKIVLVLSIDEFPNKNQDIPDYILNIINLFDIEILWDQGNIKSHKKLIPTLEKYPDATILCLDDDKIYPEDLVDIFKETHESYPNDVIFGGAFDALYPENNRIICKKLNNIEGNYNQLLANQEITIEKPANGCFGALYPSHTFTDSHFFNRDLFMYLCPNCDESWHYLFCVLNNKTMRTPQKIYSIIEDLPFTRESGLCKVYGPETYTEYHTNFIKYFPNYYTKLKKLYNKYKRINNQFIQAGL